MGDAAENRATGPWCNRCGRPAQVTGDAELGRAVHAATGLEQGADGHVCAPVDFETAAVRAARGRVAALGFP